MMEAVCSSEVLGVCPGRRPRDERKFESSLQFAKAQGTLLFFNHPQNQMLSAVRSSNVARDKGRYMRRGSSNTGGKRKGTDGRRSQTVEGGRIPVHLSSSQPQSEFVLVGRGCGHGRGVCRSGQHLGLTGTSL